jgi:hypothetical protein
MMVIPFCFLKMFNMTGLLPIEFSLKVGRSSPEPYLVLTITLPAPLWAVISAL